MIWYADVEQGSDEWRAIRCGKVTASRIVDVTAKIKTGEAATRAAYKAQLALERMTGLVVPTYQSSDMEWGNEWEPVARGEYEVRRDCLVDQLAFGDHPTIRMSGASPDGLVGRDGSIEAKCPKTTTHIQTLLTRKIPREYFLQAQWVMECHDRKWCDYMSYDPRMPEHLRLIVIRIDRDEELLKEIRAEVEKFTAEVDEMVESLAKIVLD